MILTDDEIIQADDLSLELQTALEEPPEPRELTYAEAKEKWECDYLKTLLQKNKWNISLVARLIGMDKSNLRKKLRDLGINAKDFEK
ncbi:MAG: helix-turn-helix domain-containing protein [bacterium]